MAPYNTRFRKRKAESDYQELRAEFGLDPMPMDEARRRQREHECEARAETAAAAAALDRALAAPADAHNDAVDAAVAGDGAADADADAQSDAAFFNVSVDTIQEADARALDNEDIEAGRAPRRATASMSERYVAAVGAAASRDSLLESRIHLAEGTTPTGRAPPTGIGLLLANAESNARAFDEPVDFDVGPAAAVPTRPRRSPNPPTRRRGRNPGATLQNHEPVTAYAMQQRSLALLLQHDAQSDDPADPSSIMDGYETDEEDPPPLPVNTPDATTTANPVTVTLSTPNQSTTATQSTPTAPVPFGLQAIEDSIVAESTMRSYNADAFQFLSWLFSKEALWVYLTDHCRALFRSIERREQETDAQYQRRLSAAVKLALTRCKVEPLIHVDVMDANCFITWIDGLFNKTTLKKLSMSSYGNKRAMLNHLFRLHNGVGIPPALDQQVGIKMQGFYRQLAKSRPAGYKDSGKSPMSAQLYQAIASWFIEWGTLNGVFAHCFLVLSWNLMCRSENTQNIHLCDITWTKFDCFEIKFAHTKGDQKGEAAKYTRHIYSNPHNPRICPVFALGTYLSLISHCPAMDDPLFPSGGGGKSGQAARFGELLAEVLDEHVGELIAMGYPSSSDIGTHSIRKGAITHVAGLPGGPSSTSICVRAGWTQGKVKDIYMKYMESGDCFVGRCLTLEPLLHVDFASSPPYFIQDQPGSLTLHKIETGCELQFKAFPRSRIKNFGRLLPMLYSRLIWNIDWIKHFPINHPYGNFDILTDGELFNHIEQNFDKVVEVGLPWDMNKDLLGENSCFSGCPPHIGLLHQVNMLQEEAKTQAEKFSETVKELIDDRIASGGGLTAEKFEEIFSNSIKTLTGKLHSMGVAAEDSTGNDVAPVVPGGDKTAVVAAGEEEFDGLDASAFRLHHHGEGMESFWSKLPKGWEFPNGSAWDMWLKYWIGNTRTGCPPLRFICSEDLKYLDETPIDNMRGRTGIHKAKKRPARKVWSDYKHLMDWCKFQCNKEGHLLPNQQFPMKKEYFNALWNDYIEPTMIAEGLIKQGARSVQWKTIVRRMQRLKDDEGRSLSQRWKAEEATIALPYILEGPPAAEETLDDGGDGSEEA